MDRAISVSGWTGSARADAADRAGEASVAGLVAGAVGFFFAFRVAIVLVAVRGFLSDAQTGAAISLALNYLLVFAAALVAAGPARIPVAAMARVAPLRWAGAFLALSGVSLLWSQTASLPAAAAFWIAMACDVAIILLLVRGSGARAVGFALMKGYIWGACAFAALAWLLPAQSDLRLGDEELLGPNQIGYVCAVAVFFAQYLVRNRARGWTVLAAFLAITLLRTLSKTSIAAFVAGEAFILLRDRGMKRSVKIGLAVLAVAVTLAFQGLIASYYEIYSNAGNQAETLSGRLGIWAYFFTASLESPWIGHGFHSVWKVVPPFGPFEARHAHNEWLQQFYAYGATGVVVVAGFYVSVFRHIRRCATGADKTLLLGLLVFSVVRGLADTEVFDVSLGLWLATLLSLMLAESAAGKSQS